MSRRPVDSNPHGTHRVKAPRHGHGFGAPLLVMLAVASTACSEPTEVRSESQAGAAGAAGSGGSGTGGTGQGTVCDPRPPVIDPTAIIDDMEDRDGSLTHTSGRNGSWWAAKDETPGGVFEPFQPLPEAILGERCGSAYGMRVTGQGFDDWGSMLGLSFAYDSNGTAPYDAHYRTGVRFWARVGETSTRRIRFNVSDFHAVPDAGYCVEDGEPACFAYDVTLSRIDTAWQQYQVPFAALVHPTEDEPNVPIDPSALYTLSFYFHSGAVFDLWLDDLEFY